MNPRKEIIGSCTLYLGTMEDTIGDVHADHILTDPPYLYIKTHNFDKEFDEQLLFENAKRLLPDNGFIALFGRGTSFYRWNTMLADMGFVFKEEIVWNKIYITNPCNNLARTHETVSLHSRTGKIRRSKISYLKQKQFYPESIADDIHRIKIALNTSSFDKILEFLKTNKLVNEELYTQKHHITQQTGIKRPDRAVSRVNSIVNGMTERSVITITNNRKQLQHPTEKPVRLAERILALISDPGDTIYDPFMGSGSFGVACVNTGRKYIGSEMKPEYFNIARKRITDAVNEASGLWNNQEVV